MKLQNKENIWLTLFKILLIIIAIILLLVFALFFMVRESFGINIFTISSTLKKIEMNPQDMRTEVYDDKFASEVFTKIFGDEKIYFENSEGYYFDQKTFITGSIRQSEIAITNKELSAMLNVYSKNISQNWLYGSGVSLEEVVLTETGSISVLSKIDFGTLKNNLSSGNLIEGYIKEKVPNTMYILLKGNYAEHKITGGRIIVNGLSQEDSNDVLSLMAVLFGLNNREIFVQRVSDAFCELLFSENYGFFEVQAKKLDLKFEKQIENFVLMLYTKTE